MTSEQSQIVDLVYQRFMDSENERPIWNPIDEAMYKLQWIDTDQLTREAKIVFAEHSGGSIKCNMTHKNSACFAPKIVQAISVILNIYNTTGNLTNDHKYVMQYYLALNHLKIIGIEETKSHT
jgi:hypothetical protein